MLARIKWLAREWTLLENEDDREVYLSVVDSNRGVEHRHISLPEFDRYPLWVRPRYDYCQFTPVCMHVCTFSEPGRELHNVDAPGHVMPELSVRAKRTLFYLGIETLEELMTFSKNELFLVPGCGIVTVYEIAETLRARTGMNLRMW